MSTGHPHGTPQPTQLPQLGRLLLRPCELSPMVYTTLTAFDISRFGERRDDDTQRYLRRLTYGLLIDAFTASQIRWWDCYREDRGDGVLIVAPQSQPAEDFLDPLTYHLFTRLRRANRLASDHARLELRMAVHTGYVERDANGVLGRDLVHLFRLLEAAAFKKAFAASRAEFGLIVSGRLYADALQRGVLPVPHAYRRLRVICKETRTEAWTWFPPPETDSGRFPPFWTLFTRGRNAR